MLVINLLSQIMNCGKIVNRHGTELHPLGFRRQNALGGGGLVLGAVVVPGEVEAHIDVCGCGCGGEGGREGRSGELQHAFMRQGYKGSSHGKSRMLSGETLSECFIKINQKYLR